MRFDSITCRILLLVPVHSPPAGCCGVTHNEKTLLTIWDLFSVWLVRMRHQDDGRQQNMHKKKQQQQKMLFSVFPIELTEAFKTHMQKMNQCFLQRFYLLAFTWFYSNRAFVQQRYNISSGRRKQQLDWWAGARKHKAINLVYNSSPLFL